MRIAALSLSIEVTKMGILSGTRKGRGVKVNAEDRKNAKVQIAAISGKLDTKLTFISQNPKRPNTDTADRWATYCKAKTLQEYLTLNPDEAYQDGDLLYALERKQVKIG